MPLYPCTTDSCTSESCAIDSIVYPTPYFVEEREVTERELRKKRSPQETAQDVGGAWGAVTGGACFGAGAFAVGATALPTLIWVGIPTVLVSYCCGRKSGASLQRDWIKDNGAFSGFLGGLTGVPIGLCGTVFAATDRKDNKTGKWTRTEKNGDVVEGTWDHTPKAPIDSLSAQQAACVGAALVGVVGYGAGQGANKIANTFAEVSFGDVANDAAKEFGSAVGEIVADQAEKVIDRANNKLKPLAENVSGQVDKAVAMADKGKATADSCGTAAIFSFLTVLASILFAVLLRS